MSGADLLSGSIVLSPLVCKQTRDLGVLLESISTHNQGQYTIQATLSDWLGPWVW